uniref:Transmembrane protein n=1 Tax=Chenopodium quinoa TaxID=63459 RepID=A0A803LPQ9_CHEQI
MSNNQKNKKKQVTFHYDPSSYALNFDDGVDNGNSNNSSIDGVFRSRGGAVSIVGEENGIGYYYKLQFFFFLAANSTLVYVFLIRL